MSTGNGSITKDTVVFRSGWDPNDVNKKNWMAGRLYVEMLETQRTKKVNKNGIVWSKFKTNAAPVCVGHLRMEFERLRKNGRRDDGPNRETHSGLVEFLPGRVHLLARKEPSDS